MKQVDLLNNLQPSTRIDSKSHVHTAEVVYKYSLMSESCVHNFNLPTHNFRKFSDRQCVKNHPWLTTEVVLFHFRNFDLCGQFNEGILMTVMSLARKNDGSITGKHSLTFFGLFNNIHHTFLWIKVFLGFETNV